MSAGVVWVNGALGGAIDPADRGFTLGDGVFDTAVAFNRKPFAADLHLRRLVGHAAAIGIAADPAAIGAGWEAVLGAAEHDPAILRTTISRGVAARGLWPKTAPPAPTIVVAAAPWSAEIVGREVRLVTSAIVRNAGSPAARIKSLNYLDNILAAREAAAAEADDALLLNAAGKVACTTIANVFAIQGDALVTPPLSDGVMPGIVRGLVLEGSAALGLYPKERSLAVADLPAADAVFLTNSVRLVAPVRALDGKPLGGAPGKVAAILALLAARIRAEHGFDIGAPSPP